VVEKLLRASETAAELAVGCDSRYNAATPATVGAAIEVPLRVAVAVSLLYQVEGMAVPGAKISTQAPLFE